MAHASTFVIKQLRDASASYEKDFLALTPEQQSQAFGGVSRSAFDMTEELVQVHTRLAARLRGEDPGPWPYDGFIRASEEHQHADAMLARFRASVDEVVAAYEGLSDAAKDETMNVFGGDTTPTGVVGFLGYHVGYHDGQLNYIQSMLGDGEMHR